MIELILNLVVSSLWIWGIHCIFEPRFVGYRMLYNLFSRSWEDLHDRYYMKPVLSCPACMSSLHGLLMAFSLDVPLHQWPLFIITLCGLNFILIEVLYGEK